VGTELEVRIAYLLQEIFLTIKRRRNSGCDRLSVQRNARRLFWVVVAAIVLYVVLDAIAQSLPPHYSPIKDVESDLAVGPYGWVMVINFLNRGALSLVFLYALAETARSNGELGRSFRIGIYTFGVWAVGAIILAFFPTDVPATPISWHGAIHLVVAILAFFGGAFGALIISLRLGKNEAIQKVGRPALLIAIVSVILLFVASATLTGPVGGLTERLFLGSVLLWEAIVSLYLGKRTPGPAPA